MGNSIQEYCKKINSRITLTDICSLFLTVIGVLVLIFIIYTKQQESRKEVSYVIGSEEAKESRKDVSLPFGSKNGKTYTFSWCKGAKTILSKNKVYFENEASAESSGRTLSKLCSS